MDMLRDKYFRSYFLKYSFGILQTKFHNTKFKIIVFLKKSELSIVNIFLEYYIIYMYLYIINNYLEIK